MPILSAAPAQERYTLDENAFDDQNFKNTLNTYKDKQDALFILSFAFPNTDTDRNLLERLEQFVGALQKSCRVFFEDPIQQAKFKKYLHELRTSYIRNSQKLSNISQRTTSVLLTSEKLEDLKFYRNAGYLLGFLALLCLGSFALGNVDGIRGIISAGIFAMLIMGIAFTSFVQKVKRGGYILEQWDSKANENSVGDDAANGLEAVEEARLEAEKEVASLKAVAEAKLKTAGEAEAAAKADLKAARKAKLGAAEKAPLKAALKAALKAKKEAKEARLEAEKEVASLQAVARRNDSPSFQIGPSIVNGAEKKPETKSKQRPVTATSPTAPNLTTPANIHLERSGDSDLFELVKRDYKAFPNGSSEEERDHLIRACIDTWDTAARTYPNDFAHVKYDRDYKTFRDSIPKGCDRDEAIQQYSQARAKAGAMNGATRLHTAYRRREGDYFVTSNATKGKGAATGTTNNSELSPAVLQLVREHGKRTTALPKFPREATPDGSRSHGPV